MEWLLLLLLVSVVCLLGWIAKIMGDIIRQNKHQRALLAEENAQQELEQQAVGKEKAEVASQSDDSPADGGQKLPRTRQLVMDALVEMQCKPKVDEHDNITFSFQGGNFMVDASDGCKFVVVYYPFWFTFEPGDIELLAACQKAVNRANNKYGCTTFYSIYNDNNLVALHTKKHFVMISEIPAIGEYLQSQLADFFRSSNEVLAQLEKVKEMEKS